MERTLSRKQFLKGASTGVAGGALLGASVLSSGCAREPKKQTEINVVLVIIDTLRKDHVGAYGNPWIKTPNLDALAKESLRFARAHPESIPTICARRAIHTGIRTWPFRNWHPFKGEYVFFQGWQPIPEGQPHLAEIMQENDYETMLVTDTYHQFRPSYNFQRGFHVFDFIRGQERDFYRPIWTSPPEKMRNVLASDAYLLQQYFANTAQRKTEEDWFSPQVFTRASQFLEAAKESRQFFLVVDSFDSHEPWDPPEEYVSLYDDDYDGPEPILPIGGPSGWLTSRQLERMRALYAAEVTMVDRWLGRFLDKMEELKLFENTLLVIIADHGHCLGEHGYTGKIPFALWPELTDVLFFIRHPEGKRAGGKSTYYASTHDVAPTILGFLGIEQPKPMEGQDLSVLFDGGEPEERAHFTLGFHDHVRAHDDRYAMISRNDGTEARLYDLRTDPNMNTDVAGEHPDIVRRMFDDYVLKDAGGPLPTY